MAVRVRVKLINRLADGQPRSNDQVAARASGGLHPCIRKIGQAAVRHVRHPRWGLRSAVRHGPTRGLRGPARVRHEIVMMLVRWMHSSIARSSNSCARVRHARVSRFRTRRQDPAALQRCGACHQAQHSRDARPQRSVAPTPSRRTHPGRARAGRSTRTDMNTYESLAGLARALVTAAQGELVGRGNCAPSAIRRFSVRWTALGGTRHAKELLGAWCSAPYVGDGYKGRGRRSTGPAGSSTARSSRCERDAVEEEDFEDDPDPGELLRRACSRHRRRGTCAASCCASRSSDSGPPSRS